MSNESAIGLTKTGYTDHRIKYKTGALSEIIQYWNFSDKHDVLATVHI